jgi:hypothetical protein
LKRRFAILSGIDPSPSHVDDPVRQLEAGRTMGDENDGPMVQGIVAVFDE